MSRSTGHGLLKLALAARVDAAMHRMALKSFAMAPIDEKCWVSECLGFCMLPWRRTE